MKLIYVAGKYRDEHPYQVYENIERAWRLGLEVAKLGAYPIVPHKNTEHMEGAQGPQFWIDGTMEACVRCDALIYVHEGLESSLGTQGEIAKMKELGKPVFADIETLKLWLDGVLVTK